MGSLMDRALVENVHRDMKTAGPVIRLPASNLISTSHYHQLTTTTPPLSPLSLIVAFIELLLYIST
jgi:hypothetical protein